MDFIHYPIPGQAVTKGARRMYETYIFDIDGTLTDTEAAALRSLQKMMKVRFNQNIPLDELAFVLGIPGVVALPGLGIMELEPENGPCSTYMQDYRRAIHVFDGIQKLLSTLQERSLTSGVVTSKSYQKFRTGFGSFGLNPNLPHIVCADDTKLHKPNPEPLLKFLQISGARAESSIYIGDTRCDYECARNAGIDFGLALWSCKQPHLIPAKYTFEHPQDVLAFVKSRSFN
ncbi:HAD family hydrolase [Saccharibacillus sp. CPCC 101409]|uniref:HAD family hydrolase n=1 Tax=Saccharibacillus sp. CPCC 101409 TaxID=3058041 RepID=UPI002671405C|nr:HAD family hydrolase [Saccharibacillus sp. CPCC 101409]MDO3408593.1 HAD family hydrolase [Saccharibacillus sp. CPCC 101409]